MINFRPLCSNRLKNHSSPLLYRSGEMLSINESEKEFVVEKLAIDCYMDLRTKSEIAKRGKPNQLIEAGVSWNSFPLEDNDHYFRTKQYPTYYDYYDSYKCLIEINKIEFKNIFLHLSTIDSKPYVYGCYAGKDRTGIVSILLLLLIGLSVEDIITDYTVSGRYLGEKIDYFQENWINKGLTKEEYIERLTPDPRTALLLIEYINNTYKGIRGYLEEIGLSESDCQKITMRLQPQYGLDNI